MNVLNASTKLHIGNNLVKKIYCQDKEIYRDYTVLQNFGESSFRLTADNEDNFSNPIPGVVLNQDHVFIPAVGGNFTALFWGEFLNPIEINWDGDPLGLIMERTEESSSYDPGLNEPTGAYITFELINEDLTDFATYEGNNFETGKYKTQRPLQYLAGGTGIHLSRYIGFNYQLGGVQPFPAMKLYSLVRFN